MTIPVMVTEKLCPGCKRTKAASDFYANPDSVDGLRSRCGPCTVEQKRASRNGHSSAPPKPQPRRKTPFMPRPDWGWQDSAACRGEDLVLFFGPEGERQPEREIRERKAKQVCMGCPVREACLDYAVSRPEKYGIYGGLNEEERATERRRRMRKANAA